MNISLPASNRFCQLAEHIMLLREQDVPQQRRVVHLIAGVQIYAKVHGTRKVPTFSRLRRTLTRVHNRRQIEQRLDTSVVRLNEIGMIRFDERVGRWCDVRRENIVELPGYHIHERDVVIVDEQAERLWRLVTRIGDHIAHHENYVELERGITKFATHREERINIVSRRDHENFAIGILLAVIPPGRQLRVAHHDPIVSRIVVHTHRNDRVRFARTVGVGQNSLEKTARNRT